MYACAHETSSGFFAGVCREEDRLLTFRDPPHLGIREWLYASNTSGDSRRSESIYSLLLYIVSGDKLQSGEGSFSVHIGVGLCRIVDMNVGEFTF